MLVGRSNLGYFPHEKMSLRKKFNRKSAIIFVMLPRELGCAQNPDGSLKDASEIQ